MARNTVRLAIALMVLLAVGCSGVAPSAQPTPTGTAAAVPSGIHATSGSAMPSSSPAYPVALPEPSPGGSPVNGWVAYVQSTPSRPGAWASSGLHIASPDGSATIDDLSIGDVGCPTFAPVGSLLAYRQDGNIVFAAIRERGTIEARLTVMTPWAAEECPIWSPDGRAVAQAMGVPNAPNETVGIVSIDGSLRRARLPGGGWSHSIAWTYDTASILAARGSEILLVPLDGGESQVIHETETSAYGDQDYYAALESSPGGPYFAVIVPCHEERSAAGTNCLRVVGFNGNVVFEAELRADGSPGLMFAWSPDGTRIAWFGHDGMRVRSIDTTESQAIPFDSGVEGASSQVAVDWLQGLAWSPDGAQLLCEVSYTNGLQHEHAIVSVAADGSGDVIVHSGWQTETALLGSGDLTWQRW